MNSLGTNRRLCLEFCIHSSRIKQSLPDEPFWFLRAEDSKYELYYAIVCTPSYGALIGEVFGDKESSH